MGLVLDSSVLIAAERGRLNWGKLVLDLSDELPFMSSITLSELWHGCHRGKGAALQKRLKFVQEIETLVPVLEFSRNDAPMPEFGPIWKRSDKK
jgi:tRNA(fMet)-specific endonuclease VapC